MVDFLKLAAAVIICLAIGGIGGFATGPAIDSWYVTIQKPDFTPPNWLFGPVWTMLYFLMGISAYLVWEKGFENKKVKQALYVFGIQLSLNLLWSFLFFGFQMPGVAFFEIVALWLAILLTIIYFYRISKPAAYLLVPYLGWVSFASVLNFSIWVLNM
jgi:tryptophan-rich sensory protein